MSLAIDLNVVRIDLVNYQLDHLRRGSRSDLIAILSRVEIKMNAEKGLRPFHSRLGRGL